MRRRPPRSTRTDTSFPTRRSSDLADGKIVGIARAVPPRELQLGNSPLTHISVFLSIFDVHIVRAPAGGRIVTSRSEEHTSELQSLMRISYAVFCLKKNNNNAIINTTVNRIPHKINR